MNTGKITSACTLLFVLLIGVVLNMIGFYVIKNILIARRCNHRGSIKLVKKQYKNNYVLGELSNT